MSWARSIFFGLDLCIDYLHFEDVNVKRKKSDFERLIYLFKKKIDLKDNFVHMKN